MPTLAAAPAGTRSTILVVEDEVGIARMIQVLLEARGFATAVAHSGDEALAKVADHPADLVLLDVMMPGMDGYEVCRRLKADERWRRIPVMMLTAKDAVRDMVQGLEIGADDYITKPFNSDELVARIKVLLRIQSMSTELVRRNRELQTLNAVAVAVNRSLGLDEILEGALAQILENLALAHGFVHLLDAKTGQLVLRAWRGLKGLPDGRLVRLSPGTHWLWQALVGEEPQILPDPAQPDAVPPPPAGMSLPLAAVPLRFQQRPLGVLSVVGTSHRQLSQDEASLLSAIGRQIAVALENCLLYAESRRKARESDALYQVTRTMSSSLDLQDILGRISEAVSTLLETRAMSLMLLSGDGQTLTTVAGYNPSDNSPQERETIRTYEGNNPSLVAVLERRPVAIPDLAAETSFAPWLPTVRDRGYRSFVAVPLVVQDRPVGCLNLYMAEPRQLGEDEMQLLLTFASQAAISIENARLFEEARQLAITDPLTGLVNHRQFYHQLGLEVRRAQRYNRDLTMLMLDLDHFKQFNDRYGHLAGDQALREVAEVLRQNARSVDILARYGGEEFAIVLPETDLRRAAFQAERIRAAVAAHVFLRDRGAEGKTLTVSVGVAGLTPRHQKIEDLVHDADQALYRAKAAGRNRLELSPALEETAGSS